MMNKTYNTFHKQLHFLPEIYRKCGYTKFSELMVALMLAEKNNELLIKNHNSRPTGAKAFPEVNATAVENSERRNQSNRGYGRRFNNKREKTYNPKWKGSNKWVRSEQVSKGKETQEDTTQKRGTVCYRCGCKGHWSRTCRTPLHLCKLYQESKKSKAKEVNLTENFEGTNFGNLGDVSVVQSKLPKKLKKRKPITREDGSTEYEEYIDYLYPEESQTTNLKILEAAYKWKKQKLATSEEEYD
ncbi:crooked neck-like protein 1 [Brassica napus]|uniref:crooked neck-like protein 1 n=1 Tax=Brassica napus TaxID=3708 RepID=UPI0020792F4B|nr:crooked neck-like protein 1 [Brassica napus]